MVHRCRLHIEMKSRDGLSTEKGRIHSFQSRVWVGGGIEKNANPSILPKIWQEQLCKNRKYRKSKWGLTNQPTN